MKLSLVESRLLEGSATVTEGTNRDLLKLYRRKRKLSKLFLGFTEMEAAWKEFRTIYSVKEYLLPLGKHNGAEMY